MTLSLTSEFSETKRHLIEAGIALMRRKGFNATSVDEICHAAEVTKGAFFHYFKSKEDLAKAAITWFQENKVNDFANAPFRKLADPLDRVLGRLDYLKESYCGENRLIKGCLFGMFAQEMSFINPALRGLCQDAFMQASADVARDLTEAKTLHAPDASFDPKNVAMLYVSIVQGSLMLAKTSEDNRVILENLDQFRSYLQSLFGTSPAKLTNVSATDSSKNQLN